jgi:hypothetical protein
MAAPTLSELLEDPARTDAVEPRDVPAILGQLEAVRAALWQRLTTPAMAAPPPAHLAGVTPSDWCTMEEAADLLRCSVRTIQRRMRDTWTEGVEYTRPTAGVPRLSRAALEAWQRSPSARAAAADRGLAYAGGIEPGPRALQRLRNKSTAGRDGTRTGRAPA